MKQVVETVVGSLQFIVVALVVINLINIAYKYM